MVVKRSIYQLFLFITRSILKISIHGENNVPSVPAALVVANHTSYLDVFIVGVAIFPQLHRVRWVISMANYNYWFLRWFYNLFGVIPARGKTVDRVREVLQEGHWVVIFPEGANKWCSCGNASEQEAASRLKTGAAVVALSTGVPIIPLRIDGADKVLPPKSFRINRAHKIHVSVGAPFSYPVLKEGMPDRLVLAGYAADIMEHIRKADAAA